MFKSSAEQKYPIIANIMSESSLVEYKSFCQQKSINLYSCGREILIKKSFLFCIC